MPDITILQDIVAKASDPIWLDQHANDIQDIIQHQSRSTPGLEVAVDAIIALMPHVIEREDYKQWAALLQTVYNRSEYAEYNGFDGEHTRDISPVFIMQKRKPMAQLPTRTTRRKRVFVHPTQMFEMYLILLLGRYMNGNDLIPEATIEDVMRLGRAVSDAYCHNKMHQVFAFMYNSRNNPEMAKLHGHIALAYWETVNNPLEVGVTAYALSDAYQIVGEFEAAQTWITIAADNLAQTDYLWQHGFISLGTSTLALRTKHYDTALQWADLALEEFERIGADLQATQAIRYQGIANTYLRNYGTARTLIETALDRFEQLDERQHYLATMHSRALVEYERGDPDVALATLKALIKDLNVMPEGTWREKALASCERFMQHIQENGGTTAGADQKSTPSLTYGSFD